MQRGNLSFFLKKFQTTNQLIIFDIGEESFSVSLWSRRGGCQNPTAAVSPGEVFPVNPEVGFSVSCSSLMNAGWIRTFSVRASFYFLSIPSEMCHGD